MPFFFPSPGAPERQFILSRKLFFEENPQKDLDKN